MIPEFFDGSLGAGDLALLVVALGIALGFEFVNGFHDTANAVATVIYTRSLRPRTAVAWSGVCNFVGVHLGGTAVAFSIVHLLPVDLLVSIGSARGMAMVLAILIAAIAWNLGTWSLGLPASSSHTMIGAILGVGLANSAMAGGPLGGGVHWEKAGEVGLSLLLSPLMGFVLAAALLKLCQQVLTDPDLYGPAPEDRPPPWWVRALLVTTSTGVSVAHGSNDGQKGIGLIMLILIGLLPARYALNPRADGAPLRRAVAAADDLGRMLADTGGRAGLGRLAGLSGELAVVRSALEGVSRPGRLDPREVWEARTALLRADDAVTRLLNDRSAGLTAAERDRLGRDRAGLRGATFYAPTWVQAAVATALGLGTMVGWKRIVVTVGEKIGKAHLGYAQGASAELVAMGTIALADVGGLPVSTTHVLSSGVAGTMAASGAGLQLATVRNIALAWALTLPAAMLLSAGLFWLLRLAFA